MNIRDLFFSSTSLNSATADAGRALLRIGAGLALMLNHGLFKFPPSEGFIGRVGEMGFPAPAFFAFMSGFAEVICSALIIVGLATRPAALIVTLNMLVVFFGAHAGDSFGGRETPFLLLISAIFILTAGAGRFSIDRVIHGRPSLSTRV